MHAISVACGIGHSLIVVDRTNMGDRIEKLDVYDGRSPIEAAVEIVEDIPNKKQSAIKLEIETGPQTHKKLQKRPAESSVIDDQSSTCFTSEDGFENEEPSSNPVSVDESTEKRNQLLILTVLMKLHTVYTLVVVTLSRKMMPPMLKHRVIISVSHQLILLQILCLLQIPTSVRQVMLFSTVHLLLHSQIWSLPQVLLLSMWLLNLEGLNQLLV